MKKSPKYVNIDEKFVDALDEVIAVNTKLGIKPNNDSSIGKIIYPSNRSIISSVRSKSKHIPHLALINFANEFSVDMNYFYSDNHILNYKPPVTKNVIIKGNKVTGNYNITMHAGKGEIKGINTAETGSKNTLVETVEVTTMINNFIAKMDREHITEFMTILSQIQSDRKSALSRLEEQFREKNKEIKAIRQTFIDDLANTRKELSETRAKLDEARIRENDALRQMLNSKS